MINLPDDLNNIIDELKDARYDNSESETTCEEIFSDCPAPSIVSLKDHLNKLMKWLLFELFNNKLIVELKSTWSFRLAPSTRKYPGPYDSP